MKKGNLFMLLPVLIVTGCSSIPKDIGGNSKLVSSANFYQLYEHPDQYTGYPVRIGGRVLNVINHKKETLLEIAVLPLDDSARPEINDSYEGRVIVKDKGFIDPLLLKNHYLTVLADVEGSANGKIGETPYKFVLLSLLGYNIWHIKEDMIPVDSWNYGFGPYWNYRRAAYPYAMNWGWYPVPAGYRLEKTIVNE
ncbi:hypothetical protein PRCB_13280 [Pantoea rodasii]|uniref:Slp family lipoprotein n=1 Tax=Pantoea rodasii TaxID=1076549 RepID=A0A2M9WC03_9GAMM|nr:Slp family lipoprotein [Pantoea rodasii]ORM59852.1 hypothetical protein HA45_22390 [Pantoea rodasii]PJZ05056.1 hypothetical protein PRCB_13280 [Pantoea rodasii]